MDTKKLLMVINYLHFIASKVLWEFLQRVMLMFGCFLWVSLCSFTDLLGFITKYIIRLNNNVTPGENVGSVGATHSLSDDHNVQNSCKDLHNDGFEEIEKNLIQNREKTEDSVFNQNRAKTEDSVFKQYELISSQSKYQILSSKDVSSFIIEPKLFKFTVEEMFVGSNDVVGIQNQALQIQPQEGFQVLDGSSKSVSAKSDELVQSFYFEKNIEQPEEEPFGESIVLEAENMEISSNSEQNQDFFEELVSVEGDKICLSSSEYDDAEILNDESSITSDESEVEKSNKNTEADGGIFEGGTIVCIQGEENYDDEFIELKTYFEDHVDDNVQKVSQENVNKFEGSCEIENIHKKIQEFEENMQKFEENSDKNIEDIDYEEEEFDIVQEHKYLVKQMKMEMRYSKVKGLPTISEEFESQNILGDDLKPLNIDQKLGYKDHMAEIQMFYGCYAEKMKKLDILNYQTLHAISFLHMKDSKALLCSKKSPISLIKPYIPKLWPYKQHRIYAHSTSRLASVTHQDLELVYIGQVCNSWEILTWQFAKAKELMECDSDQRHHSSYNKVALECQQFQVLLERFLEDEAFHGPRTLHYVNNRCVFRTLLQTPMIKGDCLKDRKTVEVQTSVSLAELADMIQQLMQIFWEFVSTEKTGSKIKWKPRTEADKPDHVEAKLLKDIRLTLQQKERRLKDIQRSKNCIVKKFQNYQNCAQNHAMLTSQVELKLVARVLCLTKISTDQLMWCQRKLDNISFLGRNVHVEHSFFLFPC